MNIVHFIVNEAMMELQTVDPKVIQKISDSVMALYEQYEQELNLGSAADPVVLRQYYFANNLCVALCGRPLQVAIDQAKLCGYH